MRRLRIGMAQINSTVGDFQGNTQKILEAIDRARFLGVDLFTFPELVLSAATRRRTSCSSPGSLMRT